MKATLIAYTRFDLGGFYDDRPEWEPCPCAEDAENLIEFAGRNCYQSWNNPSGRTNKEYIQNLISQGHGSVLEHASCTFFITGVSRSLTHELIRHRHLSFSELSQRFVDMRTWEVICPKDVDWESWGSLIEEVQNAYENIQAELQGLKSLNRKQVNEQARAVLPNATETKIVVTGNFRAWRGFIDARAHEHADAEIRALALEICSQLKERFPAVFGDYEIVNGTAFTAHRKV